MYQLAVIVNYCAFTGMIQAQYVSAQLPLQGGEEGLTRVCSALTPLMWRYSWLLVSDMGQSDWRMTQIPCTSLLLLYQASSGMLL